MNIKKYKEINDIKSTFNMYYRHMLSLAKNVFIYENLPDSINVNYLNECLVKYGKVAFFKDDILDEYLVLPVFSYFKYDIYGEPISITVYGNNGYLNKLEKDQFVIIYDNVGRYAIDIDISYYATKITMADRTADLNILQQRNPRIWKTSKNNESSLRAIVNKINLGEESIYVDQNLEINDTTLVLSEVPYKADKVEQYKDKIWNEYLRLIGITNIVENKRERLIKDEVLTSQGGVLASRLDRLGCREEAIKKINKLFRIKHKS